MSPRFYFIRARSIGSFWADRCGAAGRLGTHQTTAQVHPRKLTEALVAAAQQRGATLKMGVVEGITTGSGGAGERDVTGVRVNGEVLAADKVIIALGPWSSQAAEWLPGSIPRGIREQRERRHARVAPTLPLRLDDVEGPHREPC